MRAREHATSCGCPAEGRTTRIVNRRGFTLIELLVVVSIIALLIAILLPSLKNAREQAKAVKCMSHMRGTGQAAHVFAADHNGLFQLAADEVGVEDTDPARVLFAYGQGKELLAWPVALAQTAGWKYRNNWDWGVRAAGPTDAWDKKSYMKDDYELVVCPADRVQLASPFFPRADGLRAPADPEAPAPNGGLTPAYWGKLSFAINEDIVGFEYSWLANAEYPACWRAVRTASGDVQCYGEELYGPRSPCFGDYGKRLKGRLQSVFSPSSVALMLDAGPEPGMDAFETPTDWTYAALINSGGSDGPYLGQAVQHHINRVPTKRHPKGRVNVLYADTHAAPTYAKEFDSNGKATAFAPRVRISPFNPFGCATGECPEG